MLIGVDVMDTGELTRLLTRDWFRRYVYTEAELAIADSMGEERAREFLTGRFAGKEGVLKVLRTGVGGGITPRQVGIERDPRSAPIVRLTGRAAARAAEMGVEDISISISHKSGQVIAVAAATTSSASAGAFVDRAVAAIEDEQRVRTHV